MRKISKKMLLLVITVMLCFAVTIAVSATDEVTEYTEGYYTYTVTDGKATITDVDETISGDVTVPDTLGGYPVTNIGDYSFSECSNIISIIFENTVTDIGVHVFSGCCSLENIAIPDSVISIGENYFNDCSLLKKIEISENNKIYSSDECGALFNKDKTQLIKYPIGNTRTQYEIPNGVTSIAKYAFRECNSLENIKIPYSLTSISDYAFYECYSLASVTIPDNVTSIGTGAFAYCTSLENITIPDGVILIGEGAFVESGITAIVIPDSVITIESAAFANCDFLENVVLPKNLTRIENYLFHLCSNLKKVNIPENVTYIGEMAFIGTNLDEVALPEILTCIGDYGFYGTTLKKIDIPASVKEIGMNAFAYSSALEEVNIAANSSELLHGAFLCCYSLKSVTFCNIETIGVYAFGECISLRSLRLPESVSHLKEGAFGDCLTLDNVYVYNKNIAITDIDNNEHSGLCISGTLFENDRYEWAEAYSGAYKKFARGEITSEELSKIISELETYKVDSETYVPYGTIHCYSGSTAQTYAETYGIDYVLFEDYISSTTEATCITKGSVTYTCPCGCGDSYSVVDDYNPNNHEGGTEIRGYIAPFCTEDGYTGDTYCLGCGELIEKGEVIPATDHKDEDGDDICDNCGADLDGEDEGGGDGDGGSGEGGNGSGSGSGSGSECEHSSIEVPLVNATCTQGGMSYDICSECGETLSEIYDTDALGHDMSDFVHIKDPTCTEKGEERADCSRCDYYETREIKELGHVFGEWVTVKYPTAKETGLKQRICSVCGETEEGIIDKLPVLIDEKTGIIMEYPAENYNGLVGMIIEETLDETAINIVNAIGSVAKNKVYDITLTLNGVAIQPVGKVTIRIPLPADYTAERTYVYYLNLTTRVPEKLEARYEDGYMVFETDHFSYYAIAEIPDIDNCSCNCHASGIKKFFFNFILFFQKLFKKNAVCDCGVAHY